MNFDSVQKDVNLLDVLIELLRFLPRPSGLFFYIISQLGADISHDKRVFAIVNQILSKLFNLLYMLFS